jgi:ABC-2 type transport system ATP-binding protein
MKSRQSDDVAISVVDISKTFAPSNGQQTIKQLITNIFKSKEGRDSGYRALHDINFDIKKGEFFGIVGRNGSGKSTLLKMIAGVYTPTTGAIGVEGKLVPFIELGVGFNPELSGRDNIFLNGALLGFSRKETEAMYDEVVSFAELEEHMDKKLKNYSSGMQVRLAFSIAIRAKADILLIDEVLAVGDAAFQTKCFEYFSSLKKSEKTVIFVSHDRTALARFCERGVLINEGEIVTIGPIESVLSSYNEIVLGELSGGESDESTELTSKQVELGNICTKKGSKTTDTFSHGDTITFSFDAHFKETIDNPILGITVWDTQSTKPLISTNTLITGQKMGVIKKGSRITFSISTDQLLNNSEYAYEVAVANNSATATYAQSKRYTLQITGSSNPYSTFTFEGPIAIEVKK